MTRDSGTARKPKTASQSQNALKVAAQPGVDRTAMLAQIALRPGMKAAVSVQAFAKPAWGELDITALTEELSAQINAVTRGDLQRAEAMLIAQAHTLDTIFNELARRSALNMGEYLGACETYLRLALKAQSQCRTTLETLALMKNPAPTTFVRQANIANTQQVNNGVPAPTGNARARESENQPSKLLEATDGERLDFATAPAPSRADSPLEAVEPIHRPANSDR